ncbi:MAG: tetratricopeptide repeat protein, partial [Chloroflexia bacterium]
YLDQNGSYDFYREVNELSAQAEQTKDLEYQKHFDRSDLLSNKVMGLIALLIVLATSLWLFALSEILSSAVKYGTAFGGFIFLIIGGVSAYLIESDSATPADVGAITTPASWATGIITFVLAAGLGVLALLRGRRPKTAMVAVRPTSLQPPPQSNYMSTPPIGADGAPIYTPTGTPPYQGAPGGIIASPPYVAPIVATQQAFEVAELEDEEEKEEPFKQIVTVLIATVALIAALIAYLQSDASNQSGSANRNVQQYALSALGERTYGASEVGYHYYTAAHAWKQLDVLAKSSDNHGDAAAAARYRKAMEAISEQTDIFDKTYFNPDTDVVPDEYAYASDLYVTTVADQAERSVLQLKLHNAWDAKASAYIAHLTLLAVALALFGLGLAASGFVRYIFASAGLIMVAATVVWAITVYAEPVKTISEDAIDAYATGIGDNKAGRYEDAVDSLTSALEMEPGYANAMSERGDAYIKQKYDAYSNGYFQSVAGKQEDADKSFQEGDEKLQLAIDDYEAAQKAGKDDTHVGWQLGWSYYLQGKYDKAVEKDQHVLDNDPSVIGVRLNKAIALLVQGKYEDAEKEYNIAIARTTDIVNAARDRGETLSADFWYYLNAGVGDLYGAILRIEDLNFYFVQAPQASNIADPKQTEDEAFAMVIKLRNKIAAFEYLAKNGSMPTETIPDAVVGDFTFSAIVNGKTEEETGIIFPSTTKGVTAYYSYENIHPGQRVSFKVYDNFYYYPQYDYVIDDWQNSESGDGFITVTDPYDKYSEAYYLAPGLYTIEMYVDNQYVQGGLFYIQTLAEEQSALAAPGQ